MWLWMGDLGYSGFGGGIVGDVSEGISGREIVLVRGDLAVSEVEMK